MKNTPSAALLLLASLPAFSLAADAPVAPPNGPAPSPYALVESMVGGIWSTQVPAPNGGAPQQFEMRFTRAESRHAVQYQSWLIQDGKRVPYQNGLYAWNAAKEKLEFFSTDARASLTEGSYVAEGKGLTGDFTVYNQDGSADPVHTQVTRVGPDLITEQVFLPKDDGWAKASDLRLERRR